MAQVYDFINGKKLTKIIAQHQDVQRAVTSAARHGAIRAAGLLDERAQHRTGTSTVSMEKGRIDAYVILDDTRGLNAALSIEYGRNGEERDGESGVSRIGAARGLFVLHDAMGLPHA